MIGCDSSQRSSDSSFSIVRVTVEMGLFLRFDRMVTTIIDHAGGPLARIVPRGTKCREGS
jgi:hypothetical protein